MAYDNGGARETRNAEQPIVMESLSPRKERQGLPGIVL